MEQYRNEDGDKIMAVTGKELDELGTVEMPLMALGIMLANEDKELQWKWLRMWGENCLDAKMTGKKIEPIDVVAAIIEHDMGEDALNTMIMALNAANVLDDSTVDRQAFLSIVSMAPLEVVAEAIGNMVGK